MAQDTNRSGRFSALILVVAFVVVSLVFTTVWYRESASGPLHSARKVVSVVTTPVTEAGHWVFTPVRALGKWGSGLFSDRSTQKELEAENKDLRATVMELEESRLEAERLRKLLDIQSAGELESVGARIIGTSADNWNSAIIIDKGSNDKLEEGMVVMSGSGLIGKIVEVAPYSSTVQLIEDPNSGVSAMIQSSRTEGIATGSADGSLKLDFISQDATVTAGDVVITSGMGGIYPKGIIIGEVTAVDKGSTTLYQQVTVKPIVDPTYLEEVLVVTGTKEASQ